MHRDHVILIVAFLLAVLCVYDVTARNLPYSSRTKRQFSDLAMMDLKTRLALQRLVPHACVEVACGLVNPHYRTKRISSDQRMAELQALLAMSYRPSGVVGHGLVDTYNSGKRKRSQGEESLASELTDAGDLSQDERLLRIMERLSSYMGDGSS